MNERAIKIREARRRIQERQLRASAEGDGAEPALPPDAAPAGGETRLISLRIPHDLLEKLETALQRRPVKISRNTWILEAIYEKWTQERGPATGGESGRDF